MMEDPCCVLSKEEGSGISGVRPRRRRQSHCLMKRKNINAEWVVASVGAAVFLSLLCISMPGQEPHGLHLYASGFVTLPVGSLALGHQRRPTRNNIAESEAQTRMLSVREASGSSAIGSSLALSCQSFSVGCRLPQQQLPRRIPFHCCESSVGGLFSSSRRHVVLAHGGGAAAVSLKSIATEQVEASSTAKSEASAESQTSRLLGSINGANGSAATLDRNGIDNHSSSHGGGIEMTSSEIVNGPNSAEAKNGDSAGSSSSPDDGASNGDIPLPTVNGGFTHTRASRAKISAANKGKTPWNKGRSRSPEEKARIAAGVRAKNRERFLQKLQDMGVTEEEYTKQKAEERRIRERERRARRTANGGYRPTEETKQKISQILKEKWARGEVKKRSVNPASVRRGFKHTEETKAKIRETLKKRWAEDPVYRANQLKKAKNMRNVSSTADAKKRISEKLKAKWQDPEFREYMMERMKKRSPSGKPTAEHRRKISESMKKRWQNDDYRSKMRTGLERRLERQRELGLLKPKVVKAKKKRGKRKKKSAQEEQRVGKDGLMMVLPLTQSRKTKKRTRGGEKAAMASELTRPDGTVVTPKVTRKKKKKRKKRKKNQATVEATDFGAVEAVQPMTEASIREGDTVKKSKPKKKKELEPDGSISRLREERRDLYDLLYGDEERDTVGGDRNGKKVGTPIRGGEGVDFLDDDDEEGELIGESGGGSREESAVPHQFAFMGETLVGDEDLDTFDPYGLDDF